MNISSDYMAVDDVSLLHMYKAGNQQACAALISRYAALINHYVGVRTIDSEEHDDIRQEAYMGLLNAIRTYDEKREASFSTYAAVCVKRRILNVLQKSNTQKSKIYKMSVSVDNNEGFELSDDGTHSPENIFIQGEDYANLIELIEKNLSFFEKDVLFLYLSGCDYKTVAQRLNSSQKSVDNALQRARKKLKSVLNN